MIPSSLPLDELTSHGFCPPRTCQHLENLLKGQPDGSKWLFRDYVEQVVSLSSRWARSAHLECQGRGGGRWLPHPGFELCVLQGYPVASRGVQRTPGDTKRNIPSGGSPRNTRLEHGFISLGTFKRKAFCSLALH